MTTTEPSHDSKMEEHENGNDSTSEKKKQYKKLKVAPHTENTNSSTLNDNPGVQPSTSSPPLPSSPSSPRTINNTPNRQEKEKEKDKDSTSTTTSTTTSNEEDSLFHKKSIKQEGGKGSNNSKNKHGSSWGTRLRTHPKSVERFGTKKKKEKDGNDSFITENNGKLDNRQMDGAQEEDDESDLHEEDIASQPPSSPHPSDDVPLETILKHGSGWAFPREQNGKMICIFRSCPQPLRGGTKKDYIDHLRLHQTMGHNALYSMLRNAPPGGLLPPSSDAGSTDESQMSQVDGEWEGDDDDADDLDEGTGHSSNTKEGRDTKEGGSSGMGGEEELHTPKLSQRGLQLRAQMMKYGLNIFRQDSESRYLCFFMGCTMRMTTNFSRHIAKHEKKLDAISPDLVHLLKEGSVVEKPYVKDGKKTKDGSPITLMMPSSTHLIPPPHPSHSSHHPMEMHDHPHSDSLSIHHPHSHPHPHSHSHLHSSLEIPRDYPPHRVSPPPMHMQLQHMHLQHTMPVSHPHPHSHPHSLAHAHPHSQQQPPPTTQFIHHPLSKMPLPPHPSHPAHSTLPSHSSHHPSHPSHLPHTAHPSHPSHQSHHPSQHPSQHPPQHLPPQPQHVPLSSSYPPPRNPSLSHISLADTRPTTTTSTPTSTPTPSSSSSLSPTHSEIRWVYRSPLPSPLSLPLPARRPSLGPESDLSPVTHSPKKLSFPFSSSPPPSFSPRLSSSSASLSSSSLLSMPAPSPSLPRVPSDDSDSGVLRSSSSEHFYSSHSPSLSSSSASLSSTSHPTNDISPAAISSSSSSSFSSDSKIPPPSSLSSVSSISPENQPDLGAVATSLLDLRKM